MLDAISLVEFVQKSIETHPQICVKKEELNSQKESLRVVRSGYLPSIDLSYSIGPEITKTIVNQRKEVDLTRQEASASLKWNLFSGLDTLYAMKEQKALIISANNNIKESANKLALEAVKAYIDVLKNQDLLKIAKENVDVHQKYLNQIKAKVDAGVGRSSDYKQTLSRLEHAKSTMFLAKQNYENALYSFQRILPINITAKDLHQPNIGKLPANTLEDLIKLAMQNNPIILVSKNNIKVAKAALNRSDAPYYPTADVIAKYYWNKNVHGVSTDSDNPVISKYDEDSGYNALLVFNYNIFNGLSDSAKKQISRHKLLKENSTLIDSKRYVKAYTSIAYQTYIATKEQLIHINSNIKASADTVSDYRKENELGRRSIIDLLNIELEYNAARNRKVTTKYDNILSYYQILSYTGKMLEQMNVIIK